MYGRLLLVDLHYLYFVIINTLKRYLRKKMVCGYQACIIAILCILCSNPVRAEEMVKNGDETPGDEIPGDDSAKYKCPVIKVQVTKVQVMKSRR